MVFAKAVDPARLGPRSDLPEVDGKAKASLKRAAKKVDKAEIDALKKALPRIDRARKALIERLDKLLDEGGLVERTAEKLRSARNALRDHGTQADLSGALRDRLDMPVRQPGGGRTYDHANECQDMLNALGAARASLVHEVRRAGMRGAAPPRELQDLLALLDEVRQGVLMFVEGT